MDQHTEEFVFLFVFAFAFVIVFVFEFVFLQEAVTEVREERLSRVVWCGST